MRQTGGSRTGYHPFLLDICCVNRFVAAFYALEFRKCGEKREPPERTAFLDSRDLRFCFKKAGLVGETRFFPALPKTAVQQRQKMPSKSRVNEQVLPFAANYRPFIEPTPSARPPYG